MVIPQNVAKGGVALKFAFLVLRIKRIKDLLVLVDGIEDATELLFSGRVLDRL